MTDQVPGIILCALALLMFIICVKRGYSNGFALELRKLISIAVAIICLILIIALKGAVSDHKYSSAIVIAGAIVILSLGWKFIRMVMGLLSGLTELPILGALNSLLGAAAGAMECIAIIWIVYKVYMTLTGS